MYVKVYLLVFINGNKTDIKKEDKLFLAIIFIG